MENLVAALQTRKRKLWRGCKSEQTLLFCTQEEPLAVSASMAGILMSSHYKPHHKPTHSGCMLTGDEIRNKGLLIIKLVQDQTGPICTGVLQHVLQLLCYYVLSMLYFGLVPLTFAVSVDSQIWATGVIRPSHRLPHHSLNMTRVWWLSQQLRVMTARSPSLWSHLEFRLFSPMPFSPPLSSSGCLSLNTTAQFQLFQRHDAWQVLCLSLSEKLSVGEPVTVCNYGKNVCG